MDTVDYWNHNVHYQPVILDEVPENCEAALEAGCGDGLLAVKLAKRCRHVTAIDRDARMITLARERARRQAAANVTFAEADFLAYPIQTAGFDFACANTSLHHMDFATALTAMAQSLKRGGRLAVVGIAADRSPADYLIAAAGVPAAQFYRAVRDKGGSGAPIKDPEMSWAQARATAERELPGVRYRRHLLWRYSLRWTKP